MRILIVGANGLLARNLVNKLSESNEIFALINHESQPKFTLKKSVTKIHQDLSDIDLTLLPENIDVVYYLAQSNRFREFPAGVSDMMEVNINTPIKIIEWARTTSVKKFIYASSGGVYTNPNDPVNEISEINANEVLGFYLNSKLCAEMLLNTFAKYFDTFSIIRPFFIYGKEQNEMMLIPRLINSIKNEKEITIFGEEGLKINPIYVDDAVEASINILSFKGSKTFNIAGDEVMSLKAICMLISKILDKKPNLINENKTQNDLIADISLMKTHLHYPVIRLEEGLNKLISHKEG
jgi:nucleoside-diphosphate-sugar epimerase